MSHGIVGGAVGKEPADGADDAVIIGADELDGARGDRFGTLRRIAHDQNRLAQAGASSCTPPESVRITVARSMRATNGK